MGQYHINNGPKALKSEMYEKDSLLRSRFIGRLYFREE
jgi:hypothetical protein